jgi:hypothetical protein
LKPSIIILKKKKKNQQQPQFGWNLLSNMDGNTWLNFLKTTGDTIAIHITLPGPDL